MGENTKIEWTDHTFNPWIGCTKVSGACDFCYAEALAKRYGWVTWGPGEPRKRTSEANWLKPLAWDRAAAKAGVRRRVFCASLADVFDAEVSDEWRDELFAYVVMATPHLDWLLLTKRPQVALKWFTDHPAPRNVWLGTTVEDQKMADLRIPTLLSVPGISVRFLSCEPMLGPVDVIGTLARWQDATPWRDRSHIGLGRPLINWVIAGGESGRSARLSHPDWFRALRDQCQAAGFAFHFKQWGEYHPSADHFEANCNRTPEAIHVNGDREFRPSEQFRLLSSRAPGWAGMCKLGKKRAGATLDGREWREFPT